MQRRAKRPPPDLFVEAPQVGLSLSLKKQLITLLEAMLAEIATAIAKEEIGDD